MLISMMLTPDRDQQWCRDTPKRTRAATSPAEHVPTHFEVYGTIVPIGISLYFHHIILVPPLIPLSGQLNSDARLECFAPHRVSFEHPGRFAGRIFKS